jgi:hypothetical protein
MKLEDLASIRGARVFYNESADLRVVECLDCDLRWGEGHIADPDEAIRVRDEHNNLFHSGEIV